MKIISCVNFSGLKQSLALREAMITWVLVLCVLINSICPRSLIELKNYDVVVLAVGSQTVFLHLFELPNKVSIELASLLFGDRTLPMNKKTKHENKPEGGANSSSDYSILSSVQTQNLRDYRQLDVVGAGNVTLNSGIIWGEAAGVSLAARNIGVLYILVMLIFFSRPRGETVIRIIKTIINEMRPGFSKMPGFHFVEALP